MRGGVRGVDPEPHVPVARLRLARAHGPEGVSAEAARRLALAGRLTFG
ncbi:hypothetical protein Mterra_02237 [Calidithermus terrae]|uniref:Uncharacterized protein n=1 Tax=Calidithermus terrae TaxID=1408545 RepID=A0A399EJT9_9DEIN|nr:hypothetical protein Mterra_02237 [Calidithermus terrae]